MIPPCLLYCPLFYDMNCKIGSVTQKVLFLSSQISHFKYKAVWYNFIFTKKMYALNYDTDLIKLCPKTSTLRCQTLTWRQPWSGPVLQERYTLKGKLEQVGFDIQEHIIASWNQIIWQCFMIVRANSLSTVYTYIFITSSQGMSMYSRWNKTLLFASFFIAAFLSLRPSSLSLGSCAA